MASPGDATFPTSIISEDEDQSPLQPRPVHRNLLPAADPSSSMQPSQASAFNGLPDPSELSNTTNTRARPGVFGLMSLPQQHWTSAAQLAAQHAGNGIRPLVYVPAIQPRRASREENTPSGPSGNRGSRSAAASVKRRKLENGQSQPGHTSSAPILPAQFTDSPPPQTPSPGPRMSNGSQASASKPTVITGAQRAPASSPSISSDGKTTGHTLSDGARDEDCLSYQSLWCRSGFT